MSSYITTLFNVKGKVAALTGAGGYLVGEIASGFIKAGAKVALLDTDSDRLEKVFEKIKADGGDALVLPTDVTSKESFEGALEKVLERIEINGPRVAAVLIEPIQGEGGINVGNVNFFQQLKNR